MRGRTRRGLALAAAVLLVGALAQPSSASSMSLPASADAFVLSSNPNANRGGTTGLRVQNDVKRSYVRFDVPAFPAGDALTSAILRLPATSAAKCSLGVDVLRSASDAWGEKTITWLNQPGPAGAVLDTETWTASGARHFDVTSAVTGPGVISFVVRHAVGCAAKADATFSSRETGLGPQLLVETAPGTTPPPECSDSLDNDGDRLIDYPADPGCTGPDDDDETDPGVPPGAIVACVSETGTGGVCVDGTALDGATGVTVSPDSASVYVASETSRSVSIFDRDGASGQISQLAGSQGCISESGTAGACVDGRAMVGPRGVAVSPDGKNFYFPASGSKSIAIFRRDVTTGELQQLAGTAGCVSETGTNGACSDGTALDGARGVGISPDGTSVYVAAFFSDAVAVFSRDPSTGALTQRTGTNGCISETGTSGACTDGTGLDGVRSVAVSSDGNSVYAASETSGAVTIFARDPVTGALTQLAGTAGCVSQTGTGGACAIGRGLGGAADVSVSGDGNNVYVAALASDAVAAFTRDPATGGLRQLVGQAGCISETGNNGVCGDGIALDRARSVVVSEDDANVYVASEISDAVSVFRRDATTGALQQLAGTSGCVSETGTGGACADGLALDGVRSVDTSPDGKSVYAASFWSSAISIFVRDPATGALTHP